MGGIMLYEYDPRDNLVKVVDPAGNYAFETDYDVLGNKVETRDPDMGTWNYGYDIFGMIVWQRDAKGQETSMTYDSLGRKVQSSHRQYRSNWQYDGSQHGVGKIQKVTDSDGFERTYSYDAKGRETLVMQKFDQETFKIRTEYNKMGRIARQDYPENKQIYFCYSDKGFLTMVKKSECNGGTSGVYWNGLEYDPHGHMTKERYENNMQTEYRYTLGAYTKHITTKNMVNGATVRRWDYEHDEGSNMISRKDSLGTIETFQYDALDRVVRSHLRKTDLNQHQQVALTEDWEYDAIGNIRRYSGFGGLNHVYGNENNKNNKPHTLLKAGPNKYSYDANGNLEKKNDLMVAWTYFNKLQWFDTGRSGRVYLHYDPDQVRYKKVGPGNTNTVYLGKLYERVTTSNSGTTSNVHKYFIYALGKLIAVESKKDTNNPETAYIHYDHQGSVDTVTNDQGTVTETIRYNAFGRRRRKDWFQYKVGLDLLQPGSVSTKRGYTGHEHIDELDLINMNGRVYDPLVGRFLSADAVVQDPYNTQSFNRYSYAINNPLKHDDPTGHFFKSIRKGFRKVGRGLRKIGRSIEKHLKIFVKEVVNTAKQVYKEIKPFIRPAIALGLRIGSKVAGTFLSTLGPLGMVAGIAVVALGEYAACRVEGKSHKEAMNSALFAGGMFAIGLATANSGGEIMNWIKGKSSVAHDVIQFGKDYGPYYKDVLNFWNAFRENGPPMTLIAMTSDPNGFMLEKNVKNSNVRAGINLLYSNTVDMFPTPLASIIHRQGPDHGLLVDKTKGYLLGVI